MSDTFHDGLTFAVDKKAMDRGEATPEQELNVVAASVKVVDPAPLVNQEPPPVPPPAHTDEH